MKEQIILIHPNYTVTVHDLDTGDILGDLQRKVGGYIQTVFMKRLEPPCLMIVNEDGKLTGLPVNAMASWLYGISADLIVGPAVICKQALRDGEPDLVGFEEEEADRILRQILDGFMDAVTGLDPEGGAQ